MKHTPGPWAIDPRAQNHVIAGERSICSISYHDSGNPDKSRADNEANAKLIAAAPDLLAALRMMCDTFDHPGLRGLVVDAKQHGWTMDDVNRQAHSCRTARAAIAKAAADD